jgi:predicted Rossmann fold flavoprotein
VDTRPGLVPLTFGRGEARAFEDLAGVSAMVEVSSADGTAKGRGAGQAAPKFREKMLFTHRGLSGPAILQVSSYWGTGESVRVDLAPGLEWTADLRDGGGRRDVAAARTALRRILPTRLADAWIDWGVKSGKVGGNWTNAGLAAAESEVHAWEVRPAGTEGYEKAEVTVGGVNTEEFSSKTMESRLAPGLYFVGEVVDVTGWLGGFNFQWAWASGQRRAERYENEDEASKQRGSEVAEKTGRLGRFVAPPGGCGCVRSKESAR